MTKLSEVDAILIQYGDSLSPAALSFKIDGILTPEQCAARLSHLLESPDWLTAAQQDQLVTLKMRQLIANLEEMTLTARVAEVLVNALKALGDRLDKRAAATEKDLRTLYSFQGQVMLDAVNTAMTHMRNSLTGGAKLSEDEWDGALESAIRHAQLEMSKHEIAR